MRTTVAGFLAGAVVLLGIEVSFSEEPPLTIVALGDSTTAGTPGFRSPLESPPAGSGNQRSQYAYWLMRRHPEWRVINQGVNGQRTDQILGRLQSSVLDFKPQVVIVLAGVNDLYQGYPADWVKRNLTLIYDRCSKQKIRVMACTILPYNKAGPGIRARMRDVNRWIQAASAERGFGFCDLFRVVEDPVRPWSLASTPDGLHPDPEGYRRIGEALADALERWLKN